MKKVLEINNLTKKFGGLTAVDNLTFHIWENQIYGLIGPNGAGKTTVFNMITAVYAPTSGEIIFDGDNLANKSSYEIARAGITRTFQNIRLFKEMTVYENVHTACHLNTDYNIWDSLIHNKNYKSGEKLIRQQVNELLERMGLYERRDEVAMNLPYGDQRRLEIARAVALQPKLLLLDEPAAGMNPDETNELVKTIRSIREDFKLSVLLIEHHMDLVMNICDQIVVINFGKEIAKGTAGEVQNHPEVIEAYLGKREEELLHVDA
ncbi:MAG: ABC transporter ATP-binding protein [Clostridiaceae bacterium]|nr:ABC transporter ATP-binding protein [Clostridiaceae bacterium]